MATLIGLWQPTGKDGLRIDKTAFGGDWLRGREKELANKDDIFAGRKPQENANIAPRMK